MSTSSRSSSFSSSNAVMMGQRTPPVLHRNSTDPATPWLVQKYGGTSVGKFSQRIAHDIVTSYLGQHKVAIVCSARSGTTKALGTTNLLLRAASEALQRNGSSSNGKATSGTMTPVTPGWMPMGRTSEPTSPPGSPPLNGVDQDSSTSPGSPSPFGIGMTFGGGAATPAFSATVDLIRNEHLAAAQANVQSKHILRQLEAEIERDCEALRGFLFATQVIDEISPRSRDSIVGFGERLSCKIMAAVLRDQGVDAEYVSLENIVPVVAGETAGSEGILDQDFYDRVGQAVSERIQQCGPRVPVITGFFGPVPGSLLRQIGRGYTDLLAALLAAAIPAAELQIWKEVDGIFTADPRKVPTARLIPVISPEEASELTYYGSEVVHPFSMEQVIRKKIPIRIKNVENPTGGGTVIHPDPEHIANLSGDGDEWDNSLLLHSPPTDEAAEAALTPPASRSPIAKRAAAAAAAAKSRPKLPTAVTIKDRIVVLNIHSNRKSVSHGFLAGIFSTLDRFGVVVDLISTSEVHVSMAIEGSGLGDSGGVDKRLLERLLKELRKIGSVDVHHDMAILSLVGSYMRNMVGIAGRMFSTLAQGNVNIEMISQGASEINISCVIEGRDAIKALNLIHQSCLQIKPEEVTPGLSWGY